MRLGWNYLSAIALYGVNGGYRNINGIRSLIPDLERFVQPGRTVMLAFDQDEKPTTRQRVTAALHRFGRILSAAGAAVRIAQWDGKQGKGVDDLIVSAGAAAWQSAYEAALSLEHWQLWQRLENAMPCWYDCATRATRSKSKLEKQTQPPNKP